MSHTGGITRGLHLVSGKSQTDSFGISTASAGTANRLNGTLKRILIVLWRSFKVVRRGSHFSAEHVVIISLHSLRFSLLRICSPWRAIVARTRLMVALLSAFSIVTSPAEGSRFSAMHVAIIWLHLASKYSLSVAIFHPPCFLILLADVPLEEVSRLLTHDSIRMTEMHYAPLGKKRREKLHDTMVAAMERMGATFTPAAHPPAPAARLLM